MSKRPKAKNLQHGEKKVGFMFTITVAASDLIDEMSSKAGLARSEFIERSIRVLKSEWGEELQEKIKAVGGDGNGD